MWFILAKLDEVLQRVLDDPESSRVLKTKAATLQKRALATSKSEKDAELARSLGTQVLQLTQAIIKAFANDEELYVLLSRIPLVGALISF